MRKSVLPKYLTATVFGAAALIAFGLLILIPGVHFSNDYSAPFFLWAMPLSVVCAASFACVFHRKLTTFGALGAALAGGFVALLSIWVSTFVSGFMVAPSIVEALGVSLAILWMLAQSHWLVPALMLGALSGLLVNRLDRRKSRQLIACIS